MLCRWIIDHQRVFKQRVWLGINKYCTKSEAIASALRSQTHWSVEITNKLILKNKFLIQLNPDELKKSIRRLKRLHFTAGDIRTHPRILLQDDFQLLNNYQRLQEVGYNDVTLYRLANFKKILERSVHFNQSFNFLPHGINVHQNCFEVANVPLHPNDNSYSQEMRLISIHQMALKNYLTECIQYSPREIDEIWIAHPSLKLRSLRSIHESTQLLEKMYSKPVKQLPRFILTMQPEEIQELQDAKTVNGVDVRKIMSTHAKCNLTKIKEYQVVFYEYKIPDCVIENCPKLFTMNVDTLKGRLNIICKLKGGQEYLQHSAVGSVIFRMGSIEIFAKSKGKSFESIFNERLMDYCLYRKRYPKRSDRLTSTYLGPEFNKTESEMKKALQIHPYFRYYSHHIACKNIEYLLSEGFTHDDLFNHLIIILYPLCEIKDFFRRLKDPVEMKKLNVDPTKLSKSQKLRLCVYLIEKNCDSYGEAIFLNSGDTDEDLEEIKKFIHL